MLDLYTEPFTLQRCSPHVLMNRKIIDHKLTDYDLIDCTPIDRKLM